MIVLVPIVGLTIAQTAGRVIGDWTSLVGGLALVAVAVWLMFFEDEDDEVKSWHGSWWDGRSSSALVWTSGRSGSPSG